MTADPKYDEAELAEAEALARALERGHVPPSKVDDAVDAADVVRMLKAPVLGEERLLARLAETEQRIAAARRRSRMRLLVLGTAGGALAMAAAALLIVRAPRHEAAPLSSASAPGSVTAPAAPRAEPEPEAPDAAALAHATSSARQRLIQAQLALLQTPSPGARDALEHALSDYRDKRLSVFEQHYAQEHAR
jgi:hypothetical protein